MRIKRVKPETVFERNLTYAAGLFKCGYEKLKDTRSINKDTPTITIGGIKKKMHREVRRICDGLLVTLNGIFMIECKVDYARLKPHQEETQNRVNAIYPGYFVLRKIISKSKKSWGKSKYYIEQPEKEILFSTDKIEEIIKYFLKVK